MAQKRKTDPRTTDEGAYRPPRAPAFRVIAEGGALVAEAADGQVMRIADADSLFGLMTAANAALSASDRRKITAQTVAAVEWQANELQAQIQSLTTAARRLRRYPTAESESIVQMVEELRRRLAALRSVVAVLEELTSVEH
jgi:hypothetical protein